MSFAVPFGGTTRVCVCVCVKAKREEEFLRACTFPHPLSEIRSFSPLSIVAARGACVHTYAVKTTLVFAHFHGMPYVCALFIPFFFFLNFYSNEY